MLRQLNFYGRAVAILSITETEAPGYFMKIQNSSPFITPAEKAGAGAGEARTPSRRAEAAEGGRLQSSTLRQHLQAASEVDIRRVSRIREAIARGELSLDPDVLAEAVMDMHSR